MVIRLKHGRQVIHWLAAGLLLLLLGIVLAVPAREVRAATQNTPFNGWDSTKQYYYEKGKLVKGQKKIEKHWYYFDLKTGKVKKNGFQYIADQKKTCYYDAQGWMVYDQRKIDGKWYYFKPVTGARAQSQFIEIKKQNKTCYYDEKGQMVYGQRKINGYWYYFNTVTGARKQSGFQYIASQNKTCCYDKNGRMVYGRHKLYGKWFDADKRTGEVRQLVVTIDPGHQETANLSREPIGPGAGTTKYKVTGGATGVATGQDEYKLTLAVGLKLEKELKSRGFKVVMTRTTDQVNLSNRQRAEIANKAKADALVHLHADSDGASAMGAHALCMTRGNRYCGKLYKTSRLLSEQVVKGLSAATGCRNRGITEVDNMSGINWSQVPVTILEMGFLSNPTEDRRMATDSYRNKMASGIADGIEQFVKEAK